MKTYWLVFWEKEGEHSEIVHYNSIDSALKAFNAVVDGEPLIDSSGRSIHPIAMKITEELNFWIK